MNDDPRTSIAPHVAFDRAADGDTAVINPVAENYGWLLGRVRDPYGHHWEIGKPLGDREWRPCRGLFKG